MNISIKISEKNKWNFPCKGIRETDGLIVGFTTTGIGTVLEKGTSDFALYYSSPHWSMDQFTPIKDGKPLSNKEKDSIHWNNVQFPIWVKDESGNILKINQLLCREACYLLIGSNKVDYNYRSFSSIKERNKWLKPLKILPEGTEIEIKFYI